MKKMWLIISLFLGPACQIAIADQIRMDFEHDGTSRSYHLYVPTSHNRNEQVPLLILLHGRSSNARRMADLTKFNLRADNHGFVVVYPEGIDGQWNYLHGISGFREQPNDSDFLVEIVDGVKNSYNIDATRIYVAGISNGGFMAQRLACYAPDKFAAFASVAAGGYAAMQVECKNASPINMLYVHGTADEKVPWQGLGIKDGEGNRQLVTMSISNSVKFWVDRNHCGPNIDRKEILPAGRSPGTQVKILTSSDCIDNAQVVLYAVIGGGHNWPGEPNIIPPEIAGRVNMDIHASDVIWSFFRTKQLVKKSYSP
jgi:polyhydroxybutyrate depolymerase